MPSQQKRFAIFAFQYTAVIQIMDERNIQTTKDIVKEIKQSFRLLMNGVTAQSMRDKGMDYHINWGASLPHLREMAAEYKPDYQLALELWKENVRECKILATILMPKEEFPIDLAILWTEQTTTQEIAEIAVMNLYQYMPYAEDLALLLLSKEDYMSQIYGFSILSRMFAKGKLPESPRDINEFLDQAIVALHGKSLPVRHSAWNAVAHFANIDDFCHIAAKNALKSANMDDWL